MKKTILAILGILLMVIIACNDDDFDNEVEIPQFNFPTTLVFEDSLSAYEIFEGVMSDLKPTDDFQLLELSATLFTDYSHKQRLVKVPEGTQMTRSNEGLLKFPDGTILTKTFYYYTDERDKNLGKRIIETRLLIKELDTWNVATYIWNDSQSNATLEVNGLDTPVSWINSNGNSISTLYHIPTENECAACHQSNALMTPLGVKLRNLNRLVDRNGTSINQLEHLQSVGVLSDFQLSEVSDIVDYTNTNASLANRARAYLDLNCAHCHNPTAWEEPAEQDLDLRYEVALNETGILDESDDIIEFVTEGEMPFIGTTIIDSEGLNLIIEFIESL